MPEISFSSWRPFKYLNNLISTKDATTIPQQGWIAFNVEKLAQDKHRNLSLQDQYLYSGSCKGKFNFALKISINSNTNIVQYLKKLRPSDNEIWSVNRI